MLPSPPVSFTWPPLPYPPSDQAPAQRLDELQAYPSQGD